MASTKTEKAERASPATTGRAPIERRDRTSMPSAARRPAGRNDRGDLRDLLGDYTEQTGAHFG